MSVLKWISFGMSTAALTIAMISCILVNKRGKRQQKIWDDFESWLNKGYMPVEMLRDWLNECKKNHAGKPKDEKEFYFDCGAMSVINFLSRKLGDFPRNPKLRGEQDDSQV